MGRLLLMRAYLVGPMDHDRETGREWREEIAEWLTHRGVIVFDPYNKPMANVSQNPALEDDENYRVVSNAIKAGNYGLAGQRVRCLRTVDLRMVDHSDFCIVNLDLDKRPCGTYEELFTGNRQKKPLIVMCPQGKKEIPPWLFGTLPHDMMFDKWSDVMSYLDHIDGAADCDIDTLKRWVFFDLENQYRQALNLVRNFDVDKAREGGL